MAFIEQVLNTSSTEYFTVGMTRGPVFPVDVVMTPGGYEKRNYNGPAAGRRRYVVSYESRDQAIVDMIEEGFIAVQGKLIGYRILDPVDYQITQELIGTGDNVETDFPVTRTYTWGSLSRVRDLYKLVSGTQTVYLDDVEQASGWTINVNTGILSFTSAPGVGVTVKITTQYHIPVRFDIVETSMVISEGEIRHIANLELIELIELEEILS